jgi:hypothetical protein
MEQGTLTFGSEAVLTYEGRLSTVRVHTNHNTMISIDTVRTILDRLGHATK